jgi:hypothetical protein
MKEIFGTSLPLSLKIFSGYNDNTQERITECLRSLDKMLETNQDKVLLYAAEWKKHGTF